MTFEKPHTYLFLSTGYPSTGYPSTEHPSTEYPSTDHFIVTPIWKYRKIPFAKQKFQRTLGCFEKQTPPRANPSIILQVRHLRSNHAGCNNIWISIEFQPRCHQCLAHSTLHETPVFFGTNGSQRAKKETRFFFMFFPLYSRNGITNLAARKQCVG